MTEENREIEAENTGGKVKKCSKSRIFASCLCILLLFVSIFCCSCTNVKHNVFVKGPDMHYFHNGPAVLLDDSNVLVIGGNAKSTVNIPALKSSVLEPVKEYMQIAENLGDLVQQIRQ